MPARTRRRQENNEFPMRQKNSGFREGRLSKIEKVNTMVKPIAFWLARSILVGVGFTVSLMLVGALLSAFGVQLASANQGTRLLPWLFVGGVAIGMVLGPLAVQLAATRRRQLLMWTCAIFFNIVSVVIEGAFFAPAQIGSNLPALVTQQFILAVLTASLVTVLFAPKAHTTIALRPRAWYDWSWRLVISAASYLAFYFVFGAVNYVLVTKPYYESHAGGLAVPPTSTVLIAETVRAAMIVLSILPFLLTLANPPRECAFLTGLILFAIGGIVPLLYQVNTLPAFLLIASGIEIFFQNFSTGIVAGLLLGRTHVREMRQPRPGF